MVIINIVKDDCCIIVLPTEEMVVGGLVGGLKLIALHTSVSQKHISASIPSLASLRQPEYLPGTGAHPRMYFVAVPFVYTIRIYRMLL